MENYNLIEVDVKFGTTRGSGSLQEIIAYENYITTLAGIVNETSKVHTEECVALVESVDVGKDTRATIRRLFNNYRTHIIGRKQPIVIQPVVIIAKPTSDSMIKDILTNNKDLILYVIRGKI